MFKSSKEKHAYKQGIKKGRKGGTVWKNIKKNISKIRTKNKGLKANRDRYLVENRIEKYGILPYRVRHTRTSSLKEAQKAGRNVAKRFKDTYVDNPTDWKNIINIYDKRDKAKYKIKSRVSR